MRSVEAGSELRRDSRRRVAGRARTRQLPGRGRHEAWSMRQAAAWAATREPCAVFPRPPASISSWAAGWYREPVYPPLVYERDTNALADLIVGELTEGVDGTGIRAGIIGEIGTERYHITPAQERVFRAAARAQRRTGACVMTHTTHFGELALEQIALLREEGVSPERIVISHLGDRHDTSGLLQIARQGVYLSVDNIGYNGQGYPGDEVRVRNICLLSAEGHLAQIVMGGDICQKSHLSAYGGKGYDHVLRRFLPMLRDHGVDGRSRLPDDRHESRADARHP